MLKEHLSVHQPIELISSRKRWTRYVPWARRRTVLPLHGRMDISRSSSTSKGMTDHRYLKDGDYYPSNDRSTKNGARAQKKGVQKEYEYWNEIWDLLETEYVHSCRNRTNMKFQLEKNTKDGVTSRISIDPTISHKLHSQTENRIKNIKGKK